MEMDFCGEAISQHWTQRWTQAAWVPLDLAPRIVNPRGFLQRWVNFSFLQSKCHLLAPRKVALIYDSLAYVYSNMIRELKIIFSNLCGSYDSFWNILPLFPIYYLALESKLEAEVNILWPTLSLGSRMHNTKYLQWKANEEFQKVIPFKTKEA